MSNIITTEGIRRFVAGVSMIAILLGILVKFAAPGLVALIFAIECKAFQELRRLQMLGSFQNPWYKDWFLFVTCSLWILFESGLAQVTSGRMVTLMLYLLWLVTMLRSWPIAETTRTAQLFQFCWIHMAVFLTAIQMYFSINTIVHFGVIWFLLPTTLVVINDIAAYNFGKLIGRTPLYHLSPNKTVEGFLGAGLITLASSYILTDYFPEHWRVQEAIVFGLYVSCVAPMGGFLASAMKRTLGIKDYGTCIPGHGGMVDRMDCQLLMGVFTYLYLQMGSS